ncbi:Protein of unknown function [Gryllus bimaculatus]|nr:Protein of unknown function [Gryllus bimaculatus]
MEHSSDFKNSFTCEMDVICGALVPYCRARLVTVFDLENPELKSAMDCL